jgi:hypothetical protein
MKFINESLEEFLNESSFIKFNRDTRGLKDEYPIFGTLSVAIILEALQRVNSSHFTGGKLDLSKFYPFLKKLRGYNKSFNEMKESIAEIAPVLGIVDQIRFSREEKSEIKFKEKALNGEVPITYFDEAEIPEDTIEDEDYVVRSMGGDTEPAYYRFDRELNQRERNLLRVSYALNHGNPGVSTWRTYLGAVPAKVGFIKRNNRSFERTIGIAKRDDIV